MVGAVAVTEETVNVAELLVAELKEASVTTTRYMAASPLPTEEIVYVGLLDPTFDHVAPLSVDFCH